MVERGLRGSYLAENGAKHPISTNSSDIDVTRRRRHGQSCFTFQFHLFRKLSRKIKMDKFSWTDHIHMITYYIGRRPYLHVGENLVRRDGIVLDAREYYRREQCALFVAERPSRATIAATFGITSRKFLVCPFFEQNDVEALLSPDATSLAAFEYFRALGMRIGLQGYQSTPSLTFPRPYENGRASKSKRLGVQMLTALFNCPLTRA